MKLGDLLPDAHVAPEHRDRDVLGLTADSRGVRPGYAFFAVPGSKRDGASFVPEALSKGAAAVVAESAPAHLPAGVALAVVAQVRPALAEAAARFAGRQPATVVAVTGTSGKTSVAAFVRQIWLGEGRRAASLGTLGVVAPGGEVYGSLTTPDPVALHATLRDLADDGVTHVALEASSHGLDQHRLDAVRLAAGAFTNLSRDHLDYHPDVDHYLAAKLRLFEALLSPGQPAVIDADSDAAPRVVAAAEARGLDVVTVGAKGRDLRLESAMPEGFATRLSLLHRNERIDLRLPLAGAFQISNALVAAGLCLATGSEPQAVFGALARLVGAPGRLQRVGESRGAPVFVDYAHKPDALQNVLATLRPYASGRLVVVFGCGGDRDPGKRPIMGEIASRLADTVIVTDDNPRGENPAAIRAAILAAAPRAKDIGDRAEAIRAGVALLGPGDVLVVAGKGHETGQIVGAATLPFSDVEAAAAAIAERGA
ncbi:MAG TPA: UDP-N-acetylmuramoyl-L-alanyl-D-glutamate--2,6-diaminopimelate ligase [Lichenihabitans sp.]|jgi:UDP-N-acetylmuramoyl-L-alanyl-D-glutamate--2,6-diaminopimelate ligase|nr:UDP-N-acetylmuramoyl-L-alanyl-D-glutamate--2,6-diaminopimelate ligase [Lichenihabitans sp.]